MGAELLHFRDGDAGPGGMQNHVELTLGGFGIVNEANAPEIDIVELKAAGKIRSADPAERDDDFRRVAGHHNVPSTASRQGASC